MLSKLTDITEANKYQSLAKSQQFPSPPMHHTDNAPCGQQTSQLCVDDCNCMHNLKPKKKGITSVTDHETTMCHCIVYSTEKFSLT